VSNMHRTRIKEKGSRSRLVLESESGGGERERQWNSFYLDFAAARISHFITGSGSEMAAARRQMMNHPDYDEAKRCEAVDLSDREIASLKK
jgi:hypothetical protein